MKDLRHCWIGTLRTATVWMWIHSSHFVTWVPYSVIPLFGWRSNGSFVLVCSCHSIWYQYHQWNRCRTLLIVFLRYLSTSTLKIRWFFQGIVRWFSFPLWLQGLCGWRVATVTSRFTRKPFSSPPPSCSQRCMTLRKAFLVLFVTWRVLVGIQSAI